MSSYQVRARSGTPIADDFDSDIPPLVEDFDTGRTFSVTEAGVITLIGPMNQAEIGFILYPQTAAEIAAGVTPTNYVYAPIDVAREGAVGDGSTDNTTALQNILNVAKLGFSRVHFPSQNRATQTVYVTGKLAVYEGTHITADAGVIIRSNITTSTDHVFEAMSTPGSATALTANAAKRDTSVVVTSVSGLAVGQLVCIRDNTYKWSTNGRNLEFNEIASIASLTVTLRNRLIGNYTTAQSAELVPFTSPARGIKYENVQVDIPTGKDGGAFYFQDAYACEVINCGSTGQLGQTGLTTWRSAYINVRGGTYANGQTQATPGDGYGMTFSQSSHHCVAYDVTFRNVRECSVSLGARFCGYIDCESHSPYDNGFNAHADGNEDCFFINDRVYFARSKGFYCGGTAGQAPDKRILYMGCESHFAGYIGFWADGTAGIESEDIHYINCREFHSGDDTATSFGFYLFRSTRPRIINCYTNMDGEANYRSNIKAEICTDVEICRNRIISLTSTFGGIIHANCTGVIIDDNVIQSLGAAQGVLAESTASTKVYVRRNKFDNDVAIGKNAGDIHEWNEYNTKRQRNSGSTSVADGGTITHGLIGTPTVIQVQTTVSREAAAVTGTSSTTITLAIKKDDGTAGTTQTIYWDAWL